MSYVTHIPSNDKLGLPLLVAVMLHAALILGISFDIDDPKQEVNPRRTLEIMVVRHPQPEEKPEEADFLAQTSQRGGGTTKEKVRPKTNISPPVPLRKAPLPALENHPAPPPKASDSKTIQVITAKQPTQRSVVVKQKQPVEPTSKTQVSAAQLLASTDREIRRLTAELDRKTDAYAHRPRRTYLSASTQEYKYASYLEAWRKKVERIGNLNYPDEAKRRKLYGNLVLHVALRPDGRVKEINIKKSSGHKLLDDAAIRIVKLASPFAPFPPEIREETDILDIIRTWQFRSNNTLFAE